MKLFPVFFGDNHVRLCAHSNDLPATMVFKIEVTDLRDHPFWVHKSLLDNTWLEYVADPPE